MNYLLSLLALILLLRFIFGLIQATTIIIILQKDKKIARIPNELDEQYQFIKGLY
jgi:hypothetical protein